jgi:hypothetical protein
LLHHTIFMHQVEDAKKEYEGGGEEGSAARLARCEKALAEVVAMGSDADVGLTDWPELR